MPSGILMPSAGGGTVSSALPRKRGLEDTVPPPAEAAP